MYYISASKSLPTGGIYIELTMRQIDIIGFVKNNTPITSEQIAELLGVSRPTIRSDLSVLVMLGYLDAKPKVGYFPGKNMSPETQLADQLTKTKIKEVQGIPVAIRNTATVHDAVVTLFFENVGSLFVNDEDGALIGIVSRKDLLKVTLGNPNAGAMSITLVMSRGPNLITVGPEDSLLEAAHKLIHHQVDALPVVIVTKLENGKEILEAVGRITKTTMTKVLLELATTP